MRTQATPHINIAREDPREREILALLAAAEAHSAELYPAESNHHAAPEALADANACFYVGRTEDGRAVAMGALIAGGDWGEIKSMWVVPDMRGIGLSGAILAALEAEATRQGLAFLRLETGFASHAALGLYERFGFERCGPFADYRPDPLSVFMEKAL